MKNSKEVLVFGVSTILVMKHLKHFFQTIYQPDSKIYSIAGSGSKFWTTLSVSITAVGRYFI